MEPDLYLDSEIIEFPAIVDKDGSIIMLSSRLRKLNKEQLQTVADSMDGKIGFVKIRAEYTTIKQTFCIRKGCWNIVKTVNNGECGNHGQH